MASMNTVPCNDCGEDVHEGEIYGEWEDYCRECYYENEHNLDDSEE